MKKTLTNNRQGGIIKKNKRGEIKMKKFRIALQLFCDYDVEAKTEEEAIEKAKEWFSECDPEIVDFFELTDEEEP